MKILRLHWDFLSELHPIPILCSKDEKNDAIYEYELPDDEVARIEKCIVDFYSIYHKLAQLDDTCGINMKRDVLDKSREIIADVSTD